MTAFHISADHPSAGGHGSRAVIATSSIMAMAMMLTGCASSTANNVDEPVTVMVVQLSSQMSVAKMGWTKQVEKDCGCKITWQRVDSNAFEQQRNTSLASETVPDIAIAAYSYSDTQRFPYFEDLTKHLDQMPNVKAYLEQQPTARLLTENENGEIFALNSYAGKGFAVSAQYHMINKTWLDKLGLDVPTTWDEYLNVLEAFKTQDPNGNGKADEIPLSIRKMGTSSFGWANPFLLLNSTGITTHFASGSSSASGIYVEDGKVGNFMVDTRFRQVVEYLHTLMEKGLIPSDALTKDDSKYNAELYSDGQTAIVGSAFGWGASDFGTGLEDQYVAIPVMKVTPDSPQSDLVWDFSRDQYAFSSNVTLSKKAASKPAAYKVLNSLFSEKVSVQQYRGTIPDWVSDEGDHRYKVADKFWDTDTMGQREALEGNFAGWIPDEVTWDGEINIDRLKKMDVEYLDDYKNVDPKKDVMPVNARPTTDQLTTLSNNNTAIFDYAVNKIATWIAKGGVENEWDDYVAQLKALGLDENVSIWQETYDKAVGA